MTSKDSLKKELEQSAQIKDPAERAVCLAAIVAEALREIAQDPILVGGAAVCFYTNGGYTSADIDMVSDGGPDLIQTMKELGFQKIGKDFVNQKLKIYIEFPGDSLRPFEKADTLRIGKRELRIISLEDLVIDRLCAYKFWKSAVDGLQAMMLMEQGEIEETRLAERASQEEVVDALAAIREIRKNVIRKNLSKEEATRLLEEAKKSLR